MQTAGSSPRGAKESRPIRLTPEILLAFSDTYLKANFDNPVRTPQAHLEWWHYACLPRAWVAIAAPRGHAKSTAITHTFVLASVCLRIKRHVLIISDTEGQAAAFLADIAKEFRENDDLRNTFGFDRLLKDNETEIILRWKDGAQTRIAAHGAQQKIRGTKWRAIRPDLIICDDLENDEAVMNEDRRIKFSNWFHNTLLPIGGSTAEIRVVGTILHEDSLLAGFMPNLIEDPECVDEGLKVWTRKKRAWLGVLYRAHPDFDDFSQLLWPEQHNEERLKMVQLAYIEKGFPEGYAQEYLNNPMGGEGAYFQEDDLLPILPEEKDRREKSPEHFLIGVDLAISKESRRAFTVFLVGGVDPNNTLRIREVIRKRMDSLEIIETFFHLHEKYKNKAAMKEDPIFLVEKENISKAIGPLLFREMDDKDMYLSLEPMPPIHDKELRARSIQGRIRAHRVEFDHDAHWWPTLKHEMVTFPRATYLDQVDAIAWVGHYMSKWATAPTPDDIADMEWEEEYEEAARDFYIGGGASRITGY